MWTGCPDGPLAARNRECGFANLAFEIALGFSVIPTIPDSQKPFLRSLDDAQKGVTLFSTLREVLREGSKKDEDDHHRGNH